jgi:hypothetical protein
MNPGNGMTIAAGSARRTIGVSRVVLLSIIALAGWVSFSGPLFSQVLMPGLSDGGAVHLMPTDAAVLDTEEIKKDLPCNVTPVKPLLGFDLRFHSGYEISIPLKEVAGNGDNLTIIFRVNSATAKDAPVYFSQKYNVPEIDEEAKGDAYLEGGFDVGEGDYHVDWMMRDRLERVCSSNWDVSAALTGRDQGMKLPIGRNSILASDEEFFKQEPPVVRVDGKDPVKVKILINFAPQESFAAAMQPIDTSALVSILRNISREPRIRKFSVVAFNMNEQRVVYRQEDSDQIDFPELGKAVASLKFGMVDYKKLTDPHSATAFLEGLIADELGHNKSDAVIFAGPKIMLDQPLPLDDIKELSSVSYPVFYLNYNLTPTQNPWRDAIGNVVKRVRGWEYTISRPRDLWTSWAEVAGHIAKMKLVNTAETSPQ